MTLPDVASAAPRPNVLLIVTDDQRADGTLAYMPKTRKSVARAGVTFPTAVTTTPNCCPSRASIMSGRYMHNHGLFKNQNNQAELEQLDKRTLIAHRLRSAGYRTGLVGKYLNGWRNDVPPPDFDHFAMSPGGFYGTSWNVDGTEKFVNSYSTSYVGARSRKFIAEAEAEDRKPWFLYVAPFAPHGTLGPDGVKLEPARRFEDADVGSLRSNPARRETSPATLADKPPFWRSLVAGYQPGPGAPSAAEARAGQLRMLLSVDNMVASLVGKVRAAGENRRTIVIFTSDNGLFWGEHGAPPVKDMPYADAVDVPLLMRWPGVLPRGAKDRRITGLIDLLPTILDAARVPASGPIDGRSLLEDWDRSSILLEYAGMGPVPDWASLYSPGETQFTEYYSRDGAVTFREFANLANDPFQLENSLLDMNPQNDPDVPALSAALRAARSCSGVSCP